MERRSDRVKLTLLTIGACVLDCEKSRFYFYSGVQKQPLMTKVLHKLLIIQKINCWNELKLTAEKIKKNESKQALKRVKSMIDSNIINCAPLFHPTGKQLPNSKDHLKGSRRSKVAELQGCIEAFLLFILT